MTLTLFIWLSLAGKPLALELEPAACHAAVSAYQAGELIQIEDYAGVMYRAVKVECVAACPEKEATS